MADKFPSTNLPQDTTPEASQRAHLDMLAKMNQTHADALSAAASAQAASTPFPMTSSGVGQFIVVNPGAGAAFVLPAGGTWLYWAFLYTPSLAPVAGIAKGGTTVGAANGTNTWLGWCWRIA